MPKDAVRPKKGGPRIFSMPKSYRGGKEEKLVMPKPPVKKPLPVPPPVKPPVKKPLPIKPKKKGIKGLVIIGALLIIILGVGGYFVIQSTQPEEAVEIPTPTPVPVPVPTPTPTPIPTPDPDPDPTPTPTPDPSPFPPGTAPGVDTDRDGLSDLEEEEIYNTDASSPDTDKDGFLDGNEVFHRYDPNGPIPGTLETAGIVQEYAVTPEMNSPAEYTIAYPVVWSIRAEPETPWNASFVATSGESISVVLMEKPAGQTLRQWFDALETNEVVTSAVSKNGYDMLTSHNRLKVYVEDTDMVMVFTYDSGIKGTVDYLQTFHMMLNSVVWVMDEPGT